MNLILIVLACCCAAPQEDQKPTPPAKSLSAPIEAALRGLGPCAESSGDRIENVDKAFDFADRAAKESDNLKSWAMYRVAIEFANAAQEGAIKAELPGADSESYSRQSSSNKHPSLQPDFTCPSFPK